MSTTASPIRFRVDGIPKGQPRPRAFVRGKRAAVYDPGTAENWKSCIAVASQPHRPAVPHDGPVSVRILILLPRPKNKCRRCDPADSMPAVCKPDGDNLAKACLDAMTHIGWWRDDSQVTDLFVRKHYHSKDGRPGAVIEVTLN